MNQKRNIIIAGYSTFSWELMLQLKDQIRGRLYVILADRDLALEAGLHETVIAIHGDLTDTEILDQLDLATCHTFIASSRQEEANILAALYAKNHGAHHVCARVFEKKFMPLLDSLGIIPLQTSHIAASSMAINIVKPAVAELVSLTQGQFDLEEIQAAEHPELVGCRLGNLQSERLHIIAVAKEGHVQLGYDTLVEPDSVLILMFNHQIKPHLHQELRNVAARAAQRR
jgi:trk system potassium uptake protein TrkA